MGACFDHHGTFVAKPLYDRKILISPVQLEGMRCTLRTTGSNGYPDSTLLKHGSNVRLPEHIVVP